jgi:hypothetical protein
MSWIIEVTDLGKPEKERPVPQQSKAPKKGFGFYANAYQFSYAANHVINRISVGQRFQGIVERGLLQYNPINKTQQWRIVFRDVQYDWAGGGLLHLYSLYEALEDIILTVNNKGELIAAHYPIDASSAVRTWERKWKGLKAHFEDKDKALLYFRSISKAMSTKKFVHELMKHHPALQPFYKIAGLEQREEVTTCAADPQIAGTQLLKDYFGKDYSLPLKTCWLKRQLPDVVNNTDATWVQVGGLDSANFDQAAFTKHMRTGSGNPIMNVELHVNYSGYYETIRPRQHLPFLDLAFSESYLETAVPGMWYKEEQTILQQLSSIE